MRLLMLFLLGALVLGGVYHARIEHYVAGVFHGGHYSAPMPIASGMQAVGHANNALLTGAAHALHR